MEETFIYSVLVRWGHVLFGIAWIGLLYYFNFVQTEYVKVADPDAKSDVMKKLAPNALWWFRWAAFFTFVTGVILLYYLQVLATTEIVLGSIMGTLMMLNVWGIIWRNQKIVIGLKEGDAVVAGAKAGLASRTNTLFSLPMLYFMIYSAHINTGNDHLINMDGSFGPGWYSLSLWLGAAIILIIELNAIFGKMRKMIESVKAVIHSGLILTLLFGLLVYFH